ncbi:MAG TPA: DUF5916 domain-containing protein [Vicinamibacteria bacterium]|nr:DUF5916 domain-containing protein [Vicinamibacteria bacterium]
MRCLATIVLAFIVLDGPVRAQDRPTFRIARAKGAIQVDGALDDPGWKDALAIDTWYETNPGDNVAPQVRSVGRLAYDDRYLYVGLELSDPEPESIKAPYADRDNVDSTTDYAGVILDPRNDGKTGILFLANPRGIQYDAVSNDTAGSEDSSPDFFWDAEASISDAGWTLEIRIPFSSLRYPTADPQTWGFMLYRNWPREFRYQMFANRLPRGGNCFICYESKLEGLSSLPRGGHLVLAPYVNGRRTDQPAGDLGAPLEGGPVTGEAGFDLKWTPSAAAAVDATVNPDFSQIESDVAQIDANERFALFYPEKRPFFLEGVELLSTPIQAVYTRTITSPRYGGRVTGRLGATAYTALVAEDEGGGSAIIPGPNGSSFADQDFRSWAGVFRARHDFGRSFVSLLVSDREIEGGGFNRVLGPDFQWRPRDGENVSAQLLWSSTLTPERPDLAEEWDGRSLEGHGAHAYWNHSRPSHDWWLEYRDFSDAFRADNGFVPQVGFRELSFDTGQTFRPTSGPVRRLRTYFIADRSLDREGDLLYDELSPGFGLDARFNTFARIRWAWNDVRVGDGKQTLPRSRLLYVLNTSPTRFLPQINLEGFLGGEIDFENVRTGKGGNVSLGWTLRPTDHLELRINNGRRWLDVDVPGRGDRPRLFTARIDRIRATYNFTARAFARLIGQYVETERDPSLYVDEVAAREAAFSGSALLAYKLNWQTVLFVGYGDDRELGETDSLERAERQFFVKLSYAWQR